MFWCVRMPKRGQAHRIHLGQWFFKLGELQLPPMLDWIQHRLAGPPDPAQYRDRAAQYSMRWISLDTIHGGFRLHSHHSCKWNMPCTTSPISAGLAQKSPQGTVAFGSREVPIPLGGKVFWLALW